MKLHGPPVESVVSAKEVEYDDREYGDETLEGKAFDVKGLENS